MTQVLPLLNTRKGVSNEEDEEEGSKEEGYKEEIVPSSLITSRRLAGVKATKLAVGKRPRR